MLHPVFSTGDIFVSVTNGIVQWRHPDGTLNQLLNTGTSAPEITGGAFDTSGNFYVTTFNGNTVTKFSPNGSLLGNVATGFNADPESIVFDAVGNFYVGQADGTRDIRKFLPDGTPLTSFDVPVGPRGSDWIDLAADQKTIFYTSEGTLIRRFNVMTNTALPDFATLPGGPAFGLRIRPNGEVLVAASSQIFRLNASGTVIQTYSVTGQAGFFALNLDPDGTSFWSADISTGEVFKFNIATGAILQQFNAGDRVTGLSIKGEITVGTTTPRPGK